MLWLLVTEVVGTELITCLWFFCLSFLDEPIVLSDSEEEEVVILEPQELPRKTR